MCILLNKRWILLVALISGKAWTQHLVPLNMDTNIYKTSIQASGMLGISSTSLSNDFTSTFYKGGFWSDEVKMANLRRHKLENLAGAEVVGSIEYQFGEPPRFKSKQWGLSTKFAYSDQYSAKYSQDAFGLMMFGTDRFKGDTADFSGTEMKSVSYQKWGIGLVDKKSKTTLTFNLYNISQFRNLYINRGVYVSDTSANSISLELTGEWQTTSGNNFHQGFGAGFDLDFRTEVQWFKGKSSFFQFSVQNLGVMRINSLTTIHVDTTITFSGFSIYDLLNYSQAGYSADSIYNQRTTESTVRLLPMVIQVGKLLLHDSPAKFQSYYGIKLYPMLIYRPLLYLGGQVRVISVVHAGAQLTYGGFAGFRSGFYLQLRAKKFPISIGTEDLNAFLTKNARGQSVYLKLTKTW